MNSYGGTPRCPRCEKVVYAAEQAMGPGRKLYHKPCLSCMICKKRLDSYSLVEHDEEPYCKNCHTRYLGTRDLRSSNLPHRAEAPISPSNTGNSEASPHTPTAPTRSPPASPTVATPVQSFWAGTASRRHSIGLYTASQRTGNGNGWMPLRPTRALSPTGVRSPTAASFHAPTRPDEVTPDAPVPTTTGAAVAVANTDGNRPGGESEAEEDEVRDMLDAEPSSPLQSTVPLGSNTPARTLTFNHTTPRMAPMYSSTVGRSAGGTPLVPTPTGTRYGRVLGGSPSVTAHTTGSPRWTPPSGATPACARCAKTVYFAEQVKAVGRTWHKACLRCAECATALAPGRLSEREGEPYCHRCYSKVHGPQGSGYALLGKSG